MSAPPSRLRRLAAGAPTPVFLAAGVGSAAARTAVLAATDVELVASPRHATVLLVAGALTQGMLAPLAQVHDQLPGPRATVWATGRPAPLDGLPTPVVVRAPADLAAVVRRVHAELLADPNRSEPPVTPASHPVDWLGHGDFGQGGKGMMGGVPYGRPMAMPDDDLRDGLALDALHVPLGPYLPGLPPGLRLDVVLQGDVLVEVAVHDHLRDAMARLGAPLTPPAEPGPSIRVLERARAGAHLGAVAHVLWFHGLAALAARTARVAVDEAATATTVARLARLLRRSRALDAATADVGVVDRDLAATLGGTIARSAGHPDDPRSRDAAYERLGFAPISRDDADARGRWRQLLDEAEQAHWLADHAGDATADRDTSETHDRDARAALRGALPDLLRGEELGRALTTLVSLEVADPAGVDAHAAVAG